MDVNPGIHGRECYLILKELIRLLRHDQNIPRETDGAVKFEDIVEELKKLKRKNFEGASRWPLNDWISLLTKEEDPRKGFNAV